MLSVPKTHCHISSVILNLGARKARGLHYLRHLDSSRSPLLDNSATVERTGDQLDREVPIACTLDILYHLVSQGLIDDDDYRVARNKLRCGGFAAIPIEADELMHWLKEATFDETGLKESAEMRILRQSTARTYNFDVSDLQNNPAVDVGFSRICVTVIHEIWQEISLTIEQKRMLSDWVWGRLIPTSQGKTAH